LIVFSRPFTTAITLSACPLAASMTPSASMPCSAVFFERRVELLAGSIAARSLIKMAARVHSTVAIRRR